MAESSSTTWEALTLVADGRASLFVVTAAEGVPVSRNASYRSDEPELRLTANVDGQTVREYLLPTRQLELAGEPPHYFHMTLHVLESLGVMLNCYITHTDESLSTSDSSAIYRSQGVKFQPWYLPGSQYSNESMTGRGLFTRGLHVSGMITPGNVCSCCVCDHCSKSFVLRHAHAGFADCQYFYCERGLHTLLVYEPIEDMPFQLQGPDHGLVFQEQLPPCQACGTRFLYYNPLRCPHCNAPYVDFATYPEMRPNEYYACFHLGTELQKLGQF
jgi:hypothetical protein